MYLYQNVSARQPRTVRHKALHSGSQERTLAGLAIFMAAGACDACLQMHVRVGSGSGRQGLAHLGEVRAMLQTGVGSIGSSQLVLGQEAPACGGASRARQGRQGDR
jgi:hypothetical protein